MKIVHHWYHLIRRILASSSLTRGGHLRTRKGKSGRRRAWCFEALEDRRVLSAPSISPIADTSVDEDGSVAVNFSVTDLDTPQNQLSVSLGSGNTTILPSSAFALTALGDGNWRLTATPAANQTGPVLVTVTASDGTPVSATFTLTVNPVNDAPTFTEGANLSIVTTTAAQTVSGWTTDFSDGPNETGQALTFLATTDNPSMFTVAPSIAADGTLRYTPSGVLGTAVVTVRLTDDGGTANGGVDTSAPQTFSITVTSPSPGGGGALDPTFDGDGIRAMQSPYGTIDIVRDVARQSDGKYVVVGAFSNGGATNSALTRFNADGSLDTSFGDGGTVQPVGSSYALYAVEIQTDGKIVVGGTNGPSTVAFRYNANGTPDTTFGSNGERSLSTGGTIETGTFSSGLTIQADGKLVLVNYSRNTATSSFYDAAIVRLTASGAVDTTFHGTGYRVFSINSNGNDVPYDVVQQADGKLLMVGVSASSTSSATNNFFAARFNTNGSLDTTFGGGLGYVVVNVSTNPAGNDVAYRVALQSDGKIVLGGVANGDFGLVRLNADGTLDTTFDSDGKVTSDFGSTDTPLAMAVDAGGKIILAGYTGAGTTCDFALARYTSTGALDTTFDFDGKRTFSLGPNADQIYSMLVQSDGKYVAVGTTVGLTSGADFALVRLNSDGSFDTTFAGDGIATLNGGVPSLLINTVLPEADGTILVGGSAYRPAQSPDYAQSGFIWRMLSDGTFDTSFGTGGMSVTTAVSDVGQLVVQPSDGKIIFVGIGGVGRLNASGTLDTTFGSSGYLTYPYSFTPYDIALQADGKLVVGGVYFRGTNNDFAVARYTSAGVLDTTFGVGGWAIVDLQGNHDYGRAIALQNDGKIVITGETYDGSTNYSFGAVRFNTDGSLDTAFSGDGVQVISVGTGYAYPTDVVIQPDGKIVLGGDASVASGDFAMVRLAGDGSLDVSFGAAGIVTTDIGTSADGIKRVLLPGDGSILAVGNSYEPDSQIAVVSYKADGSLNTSFGSGGIVTTDIGPSVDLGYGAALQNDGNLLVAGYAFRTTSGADSFVLRYLMTPAVAGPKISSLSDAVMNEDMAIGPIDFTVSHPTLSASPLSVAVSADDATLFPAGSLILTNLGSGNWQLVATPAANLFGSALVTVTASDGTYTYAETFTLTVNAVNDAPVHTVTGAQAVSSLATLTFSTAGGNAISVADVDAGSGALQTTLTALGGKLTLATLARLSFTAGTGAGDVTMTFTGTLAAINAALDGLQFAPNAGFSGAGSVRILTNDQGNTGGAPQSDDDTVTVNVKTAPTLDTSKSPAMNPLPVNASWPMGAVGTLVSQLVEFSGSLQNVSDPDTDAQLGIAVTLAPQTHGIGYYSLDNGATWDFIGVLGPQATRLLAADATTRLYFMPSVGFTGIVSEAFRFRAWDRTSGNNGDVIGSVSNGGTTSLSASEGAISIAVGLNSSPVLDASNSPAMNSVPVNASWPVGAVGTLVSQLVEVSGSLKNVSDADAGAQIGIAVTLASQSAGLGYYSLDNGTHWEFIGVLGPQASRLLAADAQTRLYFMPNVGFSGTVTNAFAFRAWDRTTGNNGDVVATVGHGGTTAFSEAEDTISITIGSTNSAPVLDAARSPTMNPLPVNASWPVGPVGTLVSQIVDFNGSLKNVSDGDAGSQPGIAVTLAPQAAGLGYYSLDNGAHWDFIGVLGPQASRLLAADAQTRLYFMPNAGFSGTVTNAFTFRAWDRTTGNNGDVVGTFSHGGVTAFSDAEDTISITVGSTNSAPVLDAAKSPMMDPLPVNASWPVGAVGTPVSQFVDMNGALKNVNDTNGVPQLGIAVTLAPQTNGIGYYSVDNGATWQFIGVLGPEASRLLAADAQTRLYFMPKTGFSGTVANAFTFRAWDRTTGTNGDVVSAVTHGGTSAFSDAEDSIGIVVS
jgi:uncharacterized delta-60 repeat protein